MVSRIISLLFLALMTASAVAANISVQVDRDPVAINESFKIIFESDESVSDNPDFSVLEQDFEILSRNQSSNIQIINGSISRQSRWTLFVMAKRTGKLNIPSIVIGSDNSPAITVTINEQAKSNEPAAENREMFIEVEAKPTNVYVQSQILYTIRFYRAVNINGANMSEPSFNNGDVVMEKLGDDSNYETQRDGRRYIVIERNYALFPQQSGTLTIQAISMDVQVPVVARGVFDPFGQNNTTRRLKSNDITLDIKPIPTSMQGITWLPASDLKLTESWSQQPEEFRVGEPITRTLTIKAEGLTAAQLPSLAMSDSGSFKAYPDQPRLNDKRGSRGISGTRQEKVAIIPTQAGELTLPAVNITWWNVTTNRLETATLPSRSIQVLPGTATIQTTPVPVAPQPTTLEQTVTPTTVMTEQNGLKISLIIFLALGWLITAIVWLISSRNKTGQQSDAIKPQKTGLPRANLKRVKTACLENNPENTGAELINWARIYWPDNPPANLGEIGKRMGETIQIQIEQLNKALYGHDTRSWQGAALWREISKAAKTKSKTKSKDQSLLLPLYP